MAKTPVVNMLIRYITPKSFIKKNLEEVYYNHDLITTKNLNRYYEITLTEGMIFNCSGQNRTRRL